MGRGGHRKRQYCLVYLALFWSYSISQFKRIDHDLLACPTPRARELVSSHLTIKKACIILQAFVLTEKTQCGYF